MRFGSESLAGALTASFVVEHSADLYYNGERRFQGLGITGLRWSYDATASVEWSGSCTVIWTDEHGSSLSPVDPQDWLAPFGAELHIFSTVIAGSFSERIQIGVGVITRVPQADDASIVFGDQRVTVGSQVQIQFKDRFVQVQKDPFPFPAAPTQHDSSYQELADLTGLNLLRTVDDGPVAGTLVYEGDRDKAVQTVASGIGGDAFVESNGALSVRAFEAGSVVAALNVGEDGTVVTTGSDLDASRVYNWVVIVGQTDGEEGSVDSILAEDWIHTGPLRATEPGGARTPYHRVKKIIRDPNITTVTQAVEALPGLLTKYSEPRATQLRVVCVFDPLLQLGDVVTVNDGRAVWTIRLTDIDYPGELTMTVTGDVLARVPFEPSPVILPEYVTPVSIDAETFDGLYSLVAGVELLHNGGGLYQMLVPFTEVDDGLYELEP